MTIEELYLAGFGRFNHQRINFSQGMNLIYGENEAGKTTIQNFIVGMLYGFFAPGARRKTYTAEYARYQPWNPSAPYQGTMICAKEGRRYRIQRVFQKENESVAVYDADTGEDLSALMPYDPVTRLREPGVFLTGVAKTIFCNTASVAQLCAPTGDDFAAAWEDHVLSMTETADSSLSLQNVLDALQKREDEIGSPKRKKTPYGMAVERLDQLEQEERRVEESNHSCDFLRQREKSLEKQAARLEQQIRREEERQEQYRAYQQVQQYEKACQIKQRIQEIEQILEDTSVQQEEPDELQLEMGACRQAKAMLEQEEQAFSHWDDRLKELNSRFRAQPIRCQDVKLLDQCLTAAQSAREGGGDNSQILWQIRQKQEELSAISPLDAAAAGEALVEYDGWQEEADKRPGPLKWILLAIGGILAVGGSVLGIFQQGIWFVMAAFGCLLAVISLFVGNGGDGSEEAQEEQEKILFRFQQKDREGLEALCDSLQEEEHRRRRLTDDIQRLTRELQTAADQSISNQQLRSLAAQVTGDPAAQWSDTLEKQVKAVRELCREFAQMAQQRNAQWNQLCRHRQEYETMNQSLEEKLTALGMSGADVQQLQELRQNQRKREQAAVELNMEQKLLGECLAGRTFEELETAVQPFRFLTPQETGNQPDPRQTALLKEQHQATLQERAQIQGRLATVEQLLRPMGEIREEKEALMEKIQGFQETMDAFRLAREKLTQASGTIQKDLSPALSKRMGEIISWLTGGRYSKVLLSRELHIRLEDPTTGQLVPVSALSRGTMDLIYLALRMELVNVLSADTPLPLILDDSFGQIDDKRLSTMLLYLTQHAEGQVLLFTCHHREEQAFQRNGIPITALTL